MEEGVRDFDEAELSIILLFLFKARIESRLIFAVSFLLLLSPTEEP